ncbi:MAG: chloride channel protein [Arthrospira platensis PCC 7345]|uniref:Voltage-gated chloride channel n=2 Tax=Limnospira platensis TaxID=118562 RepID=A0A5M3T8I4_LIMPL|nr:chloride channel protein [Arthrospira platensis]MDT9294769.1 chloride channel protein [Arthrospira platensis PCC 7345]GCE94250.1 putative voltage-gated chloride channel [Arthrospira platensis NIES-46]
MYWPSLTNQFQSLAKSIIGGSQRLAIFEAGLIGFISGIAAFFLRTGAGWLGSWRVQGSAHFSAWLFLPILGVVGGLLSGFLVERIAPEAAGSGIPQVKAALGGIKTSLDLRVAVVKLISTIITMASGFTLGRQGPTVQIGAALAAWVSRWVPTSPNYRKQLIACGAAAGLAAGFNAPIAGVLFVVEDLLHDISGLTLGPAIIASFTGAVVSRLLGNKAMGLPPTIEIPPETLYQQWLIEPLEIPFYILVGVLSGVFGVLFSRGIITCQKFNRHTLKLGLPLSMAVAGLICGIVISVLPETFRDNAGLREYILKGNILWTTTALAFVVQFSLTTMAAGSGAPGGLFAPSLILGAALGNTIGLWQESAIALQPHTTFAFAGMGAFFCAVSRTPVTAVVIVFEITTDFNLVLPLMICSVVSYLVAEKIEKDSLYDRLLALNGIELETDQNPDRVALNMLHARDVMQRQVETLEDKLSLEQVRSAFSQSHHRGFPVVNQGKLVGIISQTDMARINQQDISEQTPLHKLMTPQPVTIYPDAPLSEVLYLLGRQKLSRLPVVEGRHLVGIITRSDIIRGELGYISGSHQVGHHATPSYVVYQTRGPMVGNGRLLVALNNPATAPALLHIAAAIAAERHYELECLTIITIARHLSPSETPVIITKHRRLLRGAERIAKSWQVPIHTQIRVAHDVSGAILETVQERNIDLTLMGWQGERSATNRVFGTVVDTIIRQVPGEVVLVKWGKDVNPIFSDPSDQRSLQFPVWRRWLVPLRTGGPPPAAMSILPGLARLSLRPDIRLLTVVKNALSEAEMAKLDRLVQDLQGPINGEVVATAVCARSVVDVLLDIANHDYCDVIVLGASGESMLQQAIKGNIPEAIARGCPCTVILVRPALMN